MASPTERLSEFFKDVRQGHVFTVSDDDTADASQNFVVISQTCDVVLSKRPTVSVARVIELDGSDRMQAATGTNPRLVPLPLLGESYFADLCFVDSLGKAEFVDLAYTPGIDLDDEQTKRNFTLSITRWFGRFPFPDEVVPWLRPLEQVVREKYRKQSALGELLRTVVVEIRVEEANQWRQRPYRLEVHTIVRAEALPTLGGDSPTSMEDFAGSLRESDDRVKAPGLLADMFVGTADAKQGSHILHALAESFVSICKPAARHSDDDTVMTAVTAVDWQLWADDEFPLARIRKSEPLDLEYLSEPGERT